MADLRSAKSVLEQLVHDTSSGPFRVSYDERTVTCKFELNMLRLFFGRFVVSKNPIIHNDYSQLVQANLQI